MSTSGSERSPRDPRRQNSEQSQLQISQIEKSVTNLLIATKQLLETLTAWSRGNATESQVSDVYVRLGYEFNIACRAFAAIGVETKDLGPVPDLLRTILEETLSNDANQANLDRYLPRIRDIIVNLLQGLKRKQQRLRQRGTRDASGPSSSADRDSGDGIERHTSRTSTRQDSAGILASEVLTRSPRLSAQRDTSSPNRQGQASRESSLRNVAQSLRDEPAERATSPQLTNIPTITPYPQEDIIPGPTAPMQQPYLDPNSSSNLQPRSQDAFSRLQRGAELERRASRRFSAYQISKHLGTNTTGIPMMPPAQTSPIPNRGREARESMNAVKVRGSQREQSYNNLNKETSPVRQPGRGGRILHDDIPQLPPQTYELPADTRSPIDSPMIKTPEDKLRVVDNYIDANTLPYQQVKADEEQNTLNASDSTKANRRMQIDVPTRRSSRKQTEASELPATKELESKELTLFLQYKNKVKKFVLANGYAELSIARLQLAFIEKFAWNTHNNGVELPEIYIQDPVSGVRHELEDLSDVKNHSVLALNIDVLDEVKKHVDDGMGNLRKVVEDVRLVIVDQSSVLSRMSKEQQDAAKEMAKMAATPAPPVAAVSTINGGVTRSFSKSSSSQIAEVQSLRRDLAVMRQSYTAMVADMDASMANIRFKADIVKAKATAAVEPALDGEKGRGYVNGGKKTLSEDSEKIINRVDDLQDVVEDLRKDVVTRGVRPLPRQLEAVSKEISTATAELKKLQEFIRREKPRWTDIWKNELQVVCDDQQLLTVQEELAADLEDDLDKAAQTFALVEEATKQQNLQNQHGAVAPTTSRSTSRSLPVNGTDVDPVKVKDGVLGEIRALQPAHETRLEAIERAEKARLRELESRGDGGFKKELGSFVDEGKLKKSGGFEEAERQRKAKDEMLRRQVWERMNARALGQEVPEQTKSVEVPSDADASDVPPKLEIPADANAEHGLPSPDPEFMEAAEEMLTNGGSSTTNQS